MRLFYFATLNSSLLLLALGTVNAQQFSLKESNIELKGPQHELLDCPGGDHISITYPFVGDKDPVIVSRFDRTMNQEYSTPLAALSKENYRSAVYDNGGLFLFCSDKNGAVNRYQINDKTGALAGSPSGIFNLTGKEQDAAFYSGSAPAGGFHYLVSQVREKKGNGMALEGAILDRQCNKTCEFSFTTPEKWKDFDHLDVVQVDNGKLYLIYSVAAKTSKENYTPFVYSVVTVEPGGKTSSFAVTGLPSGNLRNVSWIGLNDGLAFTGLLSHATNAYFNSIVSGTLDLTQKKIVNLKQTDPSSISGIGSIRAGVGLQRVVSLPGGSRALLLEDGADWTHEDRIYPMQTSNPASKMPTMSGDPGLSFGGTDYSRGFLYLIKIDNDNTPKWLVLIPKEQTEPDAALSIGAGYSSDSKGNIYVFYADNKKNANASQKAPVTTNGKDYKKNVFACITVSPDGGMSKKYIEKENPAYRPILDKSVADGDGICFIAIKTGAHGVITHILSHADFHFGTITVK